MNGSGNGKGERSVEIHEKLQNQSTCLFMLDSKTRQADGVNEKVN